MFNVSLFVQLPSERVEIVKSGFLESLKVAVTLSAESIATVQVSVPAQTVPNQPANVEPASGVTLRVTDVPALNTSVQSAPQLIPSGPDVTVPLPVPALLTVRV